MSNGLTRVLLLRHAETAVPDVFHGAESDVGLSDRGLRQARAIGPILAAWKPAVVVSSAMRRAVATAEPIAAACQVELQIEADLHERRVGSLSGQPFDALDGLWPETLRRWMGGDTAFAPEGMESFDDIRGRVLPVWRRLANAYTGRTYFMVAHGVVIKVLLFSLNMGLSAADWNAFRSHNLGIHEVVERDGRWRLEQTGYVPETVRQVR
jgi:broad specificity phosphatase PhoE